MSRAQWLTLLVVPAAALSGCGDDHAADVTAPPPSTPPTVQTISLLSPASASAGTADLTVTITGANFAGNNAALGSRAMWSVNGDTTLLATAFESTTELIAVVPAALLSTPLTADVFVVTGDPTHGLALARSNALSFRVTTDPVTPSISGIWPPAAITHTRDLTITIGGDFDSDSSHPSRAVWAAKGDTTPLATTLVNRTTLTAAVPAALLRRPVSALVFVETSDAKAPTLPKLTSNTVGFSVDSLPPPGTGTLLVYAPGRSPLPSFIQRGGRQIALDGSPWQWLVEGDTLRYDFVAAGSHQLRLSNPCTSNHQPSARAVTVVAGAVDTVAVSVPLPCD
jgi:hypothetical protein